MLLHPSIFSFTTIYLFLCRGSSSISVQLLFANSVFVFTPGLVPTPGLFVNLAKNVGYIPAMPGSGGHWVGWWEARLLAMTDVYGAERAKQLWDAERLKAFTYGGIFWLPLYFRISCA